MAAREDKLSVLVGTDNPLPSNYFWLEGNGYWIYAAEQPPSTWRERTLDCALVSIGLEARARMEWRTRSRSPDHREVSGNGVAIIPPGVPHGALWRRRAILVSIFFSKQFLSATAGRVLQQTRFDLRPAYLGRDPLIEELGRALYRECEMHAVSKRFANSVATVLARHLLRNYDASAELLPDLAGGL